MLGIYFGNQNRKIGGECYSSKQKEGKIYEKSHKDWIELLECLTNHKKDMQYIKKIRYSYQKYYVYDHNTEDQYYLLDFQNVTDISEKITHFIFKCDNIKGDHKKYSDFTNDLVEISKLKYSFDEVWGVLSYYDKLGYFNEST